ncbi:MAG: CoA ester lyase [Actinobacteria bacterium]|nr:CoA ester lyase [Actinomycetota bacterium]
MSAGPVPERMRSLMFVPGDRPDMIAKVTRTRPDVVIVDLEDGVTADRKALARAGTHDAVATIRATDDRCAIAIRVNTVASPWFADDLATGVPPGTGIVLPKCESAADVAAARAGGQWVIAGIESATGLMHVGEIAAAPGVVAVFFGAEDYAADVGGRRTTAGLEVLFGRSAVVAASRAAGVAPIDQVHVAVHDDESFRAECAEGLSLGFEGKMCIHPRQVELLHQVLTPTDDELQAALRILEAYEASAAAGSGICLVDGRMIDEPLVRQARAVRDRAAR